MKILLPIITREENSPEFIDAATQDADNVLLLLVIDTSEMPAWQFGFAAGEIMQGTDFLEDLKKSVGKRKKSAVEITEWGNTVSKIAHIAELQNVDKIVLKKGKTHYWKELLKKLEGATSKKIQII
ncbi:MAG: universal stress protein [Candidatus Diapherotrites archaeon]|nr:universal stress protein [Candidatus Diapherotrites archaeon]